MSANSAAALAHTRLRIVEDEAQRARPLHERRLDHVCELAGELLQVPVVHLTAISDERQYISAGTTSMAPSLCQYMIDSGEGVVMNDALGDPSVRPWHARAYLGEPVRDLSGAILGGLCALDHRPRIWTTQDRFVLRHMCSLATAVLLAEG